MSGFGTNSSDVDVCLSVLSRSGRKFSIKTLQEIPKDRELKYKKQHRESSIQLFTEASKLCYLLTVSIPYEYEENFLDAFLPLRKTKGIVINLSQTPQPIWPLEGSNFISGHELCLIFGIPLKI